MKGGSLVMPTVNLECGAVCISVIYVVLYKFSLFCETSAFAILKHIIIVIILLFGYLLAGVYDKYLLLLSIINTDTNGVFEDHGDMRNLRAKVKYF